MAISPVHIATNIIIAIVSTAIVTILILVVVCPATAPSAASVSRFPWPGTTIATSTTASALRTTPRKPQSIHVRTHTGER